MTQTTTKDNELISISLAPLFTALKSEYKIILSIASLFPIIGIFYILNTPKEYISIGKIMPEITHKAPNGMGGLFDLLKKYNNNIDLYNTEVTSPELYVEILKTNDFYNYILTKNVHTINNKKISFKSYYDCSFENNDSFFEKEESEITTNEKIKYYRIIQDIQKRIVISKRNNLILITVKMQDPAVAADIANFSINYLIDYITKYRTEKARQELHFIENMQKNVSEDSSKKEAFTKDIQNILLASAVQMKIKIQEDKPIFLILEKAQIPVMSSNHPTHIILIIFILIGLLIGFAVAFLKNNNYKILFNSN